MKDTVIVELIVSTRTSILGYNFSAPFFISPAAAPAALGGFVPADRELGLLKGASSGEILYIPALYAEVSIEEFGEAKSGTDQVTFQQVRLKMIYPPRHSCYEFLLTLLLFSSYMRKRT